MSLYSLSPKKQIPQTEQCNTAGSITMQLWNERNNNIKAETKTLTFPHIHILRFQQWQERRKQLGVNLLGLRTFTWNQWYTWPGGQEHRQPQGHTKPHTSPSQGHTSPSIAFWHIPPNTTKTGYATEPLLFTYIRAAVHRCCRCSPKGLGTNKTVEATQHPSTDISTRHICPR